MPVVLCMLTLAFDVPHCVMVDDIVTGVDVYVFGVCVIVFGVYADVIVVSIVVVFVCTR